MLTYSSCLLLCVFVLPSWNIDCHFGVFLRFVTFSSLLAMHKQWWISPLELFSIVKTRTTLHMSQAKGVVSFQFISMPPTTYKTCLIHSKLLIWTSVTILSTCVKFCCVSVTTMCEKNRRYYFWNAPHSSYPNTYHLNFCRSVFITFAKWGRGEHYRGKFFSNSIPLVLYGLSYVF